VLSEKNLSAKQRRRLDAYRAERDAAVARLRAAPQPSGRDAECSPLEGVAEELRRDFIEETLEWGRHRAWNVARHEAELSDSLRRNRELAVLRAAPAYDAMLDAAQRRLLADFAAQLSLIPHASARLQPPEVVPGSLLSFFPEGAWLPVPAGVPAAVLAEIAVVAREKFRLQRELALAVIAADGEVPDKRRLELAAVEARAEAIRVALAALPPVELPPLPREVVVLMDKLRAARSSLQEEMGVRLRSVRAGICRYRPGAEALTWSTNFTPGGYVSVTPGRMPEIQLGGALVESPPQTQRYEQQRRQLEDAAMKFVAEHADRQREIDAIKGELVIATIQSLDPRHSPGQPVSPDAATRAVALLRAHELAGRDAQFASYTSAVMRPGLDAAARRVLFAAALRDLRLPLPAGVRRPVGLHNGP
jgi:hypothetical protein